MGRILKSPEAPQLFVVSFSYTVLTLVLTYPLLILFGRALPGWAGDGELFVWYLWWMKHALLVLHTNPALTDYVFYPNTVNLFAGDSTPVNGILSLFLQPLLGVVGSYNALYVFSFIGSGIGTYLLLRYLKCSGWAAFVGGAIFAFAPYRFAESFGHFGLLTTEWIPFFTLCLLRAVREGKRIWFALTPLFFFMTAYSEAYYAVHLVLLTVVILALEWKLVVQKAFVRRLLSISLPISILSTLPLVWLFADALARRSLSGAVQPLGEAIWYSPDLVGFFIPSRFSTFFGEYVSVIADTFTSNATEYTTSFGYVALLLTAYAMIRLRRIQEIKKWAPISVVFFLLSLGPFLHIMGQYVFSAGSFRFAIPMPYLLLFELMPPIRVTRVASRFTIITMLAVSVLVGIAITQIIRNMNSRSSRLGSKWSKLVPAVLLALVLVESSVVPIPYHILPVSNFYAALANEPGDFAILDLPQDPRIGENYIEVAGYVYMYYQTIHNKKIVGGIIPRAPDNILEFTDRTPIVSDLVYPYSKCVLECSMPDMIEIRPGDAENVLAYYGIRYVILHFTLGYDERTMFDQRLLVRYLGNPFYEDELIRVYRIAPRSEFAPFLRLDAGWDALEVSPGGMPMRWMSANANMTATIPNSTLLELQFTALSLHDNRPLEVYANGRLLSTVTVPENEFQTFRIQFSAVPPESVSITLHSVMECETPLSLGINNDTRCLSTAIRNVSISELKHSTNQTSSQDRADPAYAMWTLPQLEEGILVHDDNGLAVQYGADIAHIPRLSASIAVLRPTR